MQIVEVRHCNEISQRQDLNINFSKGGVLNKKCTRLTPALGVTKFTNVRAMILVTLFCYFLV
jgi:hypothetical protein